MKKKPFKFPTKKAFVQWLRAKPARMFVQGDSRRCPIAKAVKALTGKFVSVGVGEYTIDGASHRLPAWADAFARRFDASGVGPKKTGADALAALW